MTAAVASIPFGLCQCGCGRETRLAPVNIKRRGIVKGQPLHFARGHRPVKPVTLHNGRPFIRTGINERKPEHILIAERALGKPLDRKHPVHHADGNQQNNTNTNLVICENHAYHMLLHRRLRAFLACGDPNAARCCICHGYDNQEDINVCYTTKGAFSARHRSCVRARNAKRTPRGISPDVNQARKAAEAARR